ncbi:MAG: SMC family ATPase [candidate division KSB1 bacterium]|nr:SMC family ATPase [candidate division KSB1 bacterium]
MVIRALALTNFRRFRKAEVEFPDNLIGILGRNGSGKTTLVEAIYWALYGHLALKGLGPGRQENDSLRWVGAGKDDNCAVELWFELDDGQYRLVREIRGRTGALSVQLFRAGMAKPIAERDAGVSRFLEGIIGLDAPSFRASVFARQGEVAAFSELAPEQRRQTVNRLVGLDLIDRARQAIRSDRAEKEKFAEGLEGGLEDIDKLRADLGQAEAEKEEARGQAEEAKAEFEKAKKLEEEAWKRYAAEQSLQVRYQEWSGRLEKAKTSLQHVEAELGHLDGQIKKAEQAKKELAELERVLAELPHVKQAKERMDELEAERRRLSDLRAELDSCVAELKDTRARLESTQKDRRDLLQRKEGLVAGAASVPELEEKLRAKEGEIRRKQGELEAIRQQGRDLRDKREQVARLGPESPCPVCRRPLGDHQPRVLAEFDEELRKLRERYKEANEALRRLEAEKSEIEENLQNARRDREELAGCEARLSEWTKQEAVLAEKLESLQAKERALREKIATIEALPYDAERHRALREKLDWLLGRQREADEKRGLVQLLPDWLAKKKRLEEQLDETRREIQSCQEQLQAVGFSAERLEESRVQYENATRLREEREAKWTDAHGAYRERLQRVSELRDRLKEAERKRSSLEKIRAEIADLRVLEELLGEFRLELGGRLRPLLEHRTSELVRQTTNGRYVLVSLDQDYNLQLFDDDRFYPITRFSGGEQDLVNLCFRVAISQVVAERSARSPVRFVVLDEVFGSQDEERRQQILEVLNGLSHHFRQVFLITHIEGIRDMIPFVLEVVEKGPQESTVLVR